MTTKLNLTPLIEYFSKNKKIANRLSSLTQNKNSFVKSTKLAQVLIEIADELDRTDPVLASEADLILQEIVKQAQSRTCKLQAGWPEDKKDPECRSQQMGSSYFEMDDEEEEEEESDLFSELEKLDLGSFVDEEDEDEISDILLEGEYNELGKPEFDEQQEKSIEEIMEEAGEPLMDEEIEPEIEPIIEPEPNYDQLDIEEMRDILDNINRYPIAFRRNREALEKALEYAEKSQKYFEAFKAHKEKANNAFKEHEMDFRLKDFE